MVISPTQLRRAQRLHSKNSYLQAKTHLLSLIRPLPSHALQSNHLERFRRKLYDGTWQAPPPPPSSHIPAAGDNDAGNHCTWCGTWVPMPVTSTCRVADAPQSYSGDSLSDVRPSGIPPFQFTAPCIVFPSRLDDMVATDLGGSSSNIIQPAPSGPVGDTFFHFSDLGSAVSVCWISCEAVQPLLAQAVVANGGQAIFSGQPRTQLGVKVQDFARKSSRELAEQPAFLSASSLSATFNLYSAVATDGQESPPANQLTSPAPASSNECKQQ